MYSPRLGALGRAYKKEHYLGLSWDKNTAEETKMQYAAVSLVIGLLPVICYYYFDDFIEGFQINL